jgi:hypothetical protein
MTQIEQSSNYKAAEGCFIVRKSDGFIMGEDIDLGSADSIDNYEDKPYTEEERKAFYESIGIPVPGEEEKPEPIEKGENNNKTEEE